LPEDSDIHELNENVRRLTKTVEGLVQTSADREERTKGVGGWLTSNVPSLITIIMLAVGLIVGWVSLHDEVEHQGDALKEVQSDYTPKAVSEARRAARDEEMANFYKRLDHIDEKLDFLIYGTKIKPPSGSSQ
jgi:hypothetical protein